MERRHPFTPFKTKLYGNSVRVSGPLQVCTAAVASSINLASRVNRTSAAVQPLFYVVTSLRIR